MPQDDSNNSDDFLARVRTDLPEILTTLFVAIIATIATSIAVGGQKGRLIGVLVIPLIDAALLSVLLEIEITRLGTILYGFALVALSIAAGYYIMHFVPVSSFPALDPCSGLVLNGCFEKADFDHWVLGGELKHDIIAYGGDYAARLGEPANSGPQLAGSAWMYQEIAIPEKMHRPVFSFSYHIVTNDILDWSSFQVEIRNINNDFLAQVLHDGYNPPDRIAIPNEDLGWNSCIYDLSSYKGQIVRLNFENKNKYDGALGIWTYVDLIKVLDWQ